MVVVGEHVYKNVDIDRVWVATISAANEAGHQSALALAEADSEAEVKKKIGPLSQRMYPLKDGWGNPTVDARKLTDLLAGLDEVLEKPRGAR